MIYLSADATPVPLCQNYLNHFGRWRYQSWWDETHSKSWRQCSAIWSMNNVCDKHECGLKGRQTNVYWPPAVCSNAPSSAGITKCVTFTTSLLVSSWKSHCFLIHRQSDYKWWEKKRIGFFHPTISLLLLSSSAFLWDSNFIWKKDHRNHTRKLFHFNPEQDDAKALNWNTSGQYFPSYQQNSMQDCIVFI